MKLIGSIIIVLSTIMSIVTLLVESRNEVALNVCLYNWLIGVGLMFMSEFIGG